RGLDGAPRRREPRLHLRTARARGHVPRAARELPDPRAGAVSRPVFCPMIDTVVVLRFSAVGDVVLTAPALDALRRAWPRARIVYAVKERLAHLVRHNPNLDEVVTIGPSQGAISFARKLRALRPGAVLDLHNKMRS